jgi:hypothetical protein
MSINLGKYRIGWEYDPFKLQTYCNITDKEGNLMARASAHMHNKSKYDNVRVRIVTFKKVLKELRKNKLISEEDIAELRNRFRDLPNKGVI